MVQEKRHFQQCSDLLLLFVVHISWRKMEARRNWSLNPFWPIQFSMPEIPYFKMKETEMHLISSLRSCSPTLLKKLSMETRWEFKKKKKKKRQTKLQVSITSPPLKFYSSQIPVLTWSSSKWWLRHPTEPPTFLLPLSGKRISKVCTCLKAQTRAERLRWTGKSY